MTPQEKQERIALFEAHMAFMLQHQHADIIVYSDETHELTQVIYLSPMEKAKHPEKYSPFAWLKKHQEEQKGKTS